MAVGRPAVQPATPSKRVCFQSDRVHVWSRNSICAVQYLVPSLMARVVGGKCRLGHILSVLPATALIAWAAPTPST